MKIKIRPLQENDFDSVIPVIQKSTSFSAEKNNYSQKIVNVFNTSRTSVDFLERMKTTDYFVAESENKIIGILGIKGNELKTFYVDPENQGKGVGRKLFSVVEGLAKSRKLKTLEVLASKGAVPIYEKLGFVVLNDFSREIDGYQFIDVRMEKTL